MLISKNFNLLIFM